MATLPMTGTNLGVLQPDLLDQGYVAGVALHVVGAQAGFGGAAGVQEAVSAGTTPAGGALGGPRKARWVPLERVQVDNFPAACVRA